MSIDSIMGGSLFGSTTGFSFGSSSSSSTGSLDMTGNSTESQTGLSTASDKQTFGAQVVTATMNKLNSNPGGSGHGLGGDLYGFNTKVLGAFYGGSGSVFSDTV